MQHVAIETHYDDGRKKQKLAAFNELLCIACHMVNHRTWRDSPRRFHRIFLFFIERIRAHTHTQTHHMKYKDRLCACLFILCARVCT